MAHDNTDEIANKLSCELKDLHERRIGERFDGKVDTEYVGDFDDFQESLREAIVLNLEESSRDHRVVVGSCAFGLARLYDMKLVGADDIAEITNVETDEILRSWGIMLERSLEEFTDMDDVSHIVEGCGERDSMVLQRIAFTDIQQVIEVSKA